MKPNSKCFENKICYVAVPLKSFEAFPEKPHKFINRNVNCILNNEAGKLSAYLTETTLRLSVVYLKQNRRALKTL